MTDPDPALVEAGIRNVRASGARLNSIAAEHGWAVTTLRRCLADGCRGRGPIGREIARWLADRAGDPPPYAEVRAGSAIVRETHSSVAAWAREHGWAPASAWNVIAGRLGSRGQAGEISRALAAIGRGEDGPPAPARDRPPPVPASVAQPSRYRNLKRRPRPALLIELEAAGEPDCRLSS